MQLTQEQRKIVEVALNHIGTQNTRVDMEYFVTDVQYQNHTASSLSDAAKAGIYPGFTCGTAACAIGWVAVLNWGLFIQTAQVEGEDNIWKRFCERTLGIPSRDASYLFGRANWPVQYYRLACDVSDKAAVVAIFERALEENEFDFLWNEM